MRRLLTILALSALTLTACGGSSAPVVKLDGSPRIPDAQGVVAKASADGITLDGHKRYDVSKKLVAFSTYNRLPIRLASTIGDYVQIGLKGNTVVWLARIGVVMTDDAKHRTVVYQGDLVTAAGTQMRFKDGTVLELQNGLHAPADARGHTYVVIDADHGVVQGATFAPAASTTTAKKS